jgi:hypothetical protein
MIERLNGRAGFNPEAFLNSHRVAKRITSFEKAETVYSQGETGESISVVENSIDRKKGRDDLKIKRAKLFEQFLEHPMDTRLALAIKIIDDQIADCIEWIQTKDKSAEVAKKSSDRDKKKPPRIHRLLKKRAKSR